VPVYEAREESPIVALYRPPSGEQQCTASGLTADSLSPELIDAIARRAVELLSEKVVQDIAWEVVPELAELLIKRRLEEKNQKLISIDRFRWSA